MCGSIRRTCRRLQSGRACITHVARHHNRLDHLSVNAHPRCIWRRWFCGREHLRHELRETMKDAAAAFQQGFRDGLKDNAKQFKK